MPVTQGEIARMLSRAGYKFSVDNEVEIFLRAEGLETYRNREGRDSAFIVINIYSPQNFIFIAAPSCYAVPETPEQEALFFKACAILQLRSSAKFKYDPVFQEIRAAVEFPIMDSKLTQNQLIRAIDSLTGLLEYSFPVLDKILKEGILDMELIDGRKRRSNMLGSIDQEAMDKLMEEMLRKNSE